MVRTVVMTHYGIRKLTTINILEKRLLMQQVSDSMSIRNSNVDDFVKELKELIHKYGNEQ